jgi:hypothetical protein
MVLISLRFRPIGSWLVTETANGRISNTCIVCVLQWESIDADPVLLLVWEADVGEE